MDGGEKKPASTAPLAVTVPSAAMRRIPRFDELKSATNARWPFGLAATLIGPEPVAETVPVFVRMPVGEMLSVPTTPLPKAFTRTLLLTVTATPCEETGRAVVRAIFCAATSIETTRVEP